jgi:hypothetical protein
MFSPPISNLQFNNFPFVAYAQVYNVIGEIKYAYEWLWDAFSLGEGEAIRLIAKEKLLAKTYRKWRKRRAKVDSCDARN